MQFRLEVPAGDVVLDAELCVPDHSANARTRDLVLFVFGPGVARRSRIIMALTASLRAADMGTLCLDLLSNAERYGSSIPTVRPDTARLAERTIGALDWLSRPGGELRIGLMGMGLAARSAVAAVAARPDAVDALVLGAGQLSHALVSEVRAPTLLLVDRSDPSGLRACHDVLARFHCEADLAVVRHAGWPSDGVRTTERVCVLASGWFRRHLKQRGRLPPSSP